ncbi:hypothetical protein DFH09DRAFT_1504165 [Mycena vulgaris]|nr:hypothetical protein DFH09DRAFT_1504165 [Mycena vulgaris]
MGEASTRGTIVARGLERQRKIDGIRRWKFDAVLQTFPLLLQISLLLFAAALSLYLWTIHPSLAIIVISLGSCGVALYTFMLISAALDRDSPFQTPLAPFLTPMVQVSTKIWSVWSAGYVRTRAHILPYFTTHTNDTAFSAEPFPPPSPEASAVAWVLETSTDPEIIARMAEQATEIQWPRCADLSVPLTRLRESFLSCFDSAVRVETVYVEKLREGMGGRAVQYGRAYCTIRVAHASKFPEELSFLWYTHGMDTTDDLENVIRIIEGRPNLKLEESLDTTVAVKWALHVIPSVDLREEELEAFIHQFRRGRIPRLTPASFADYLFCVNCFLTGNRENMDWMDKTNFQALLISDLFRNLTSRLMENTIDNILAGQILRLTSQLADKLESDELYHMSKLDRTIQVYRFCSVIPRSAGWLEAVSSAVLLARRNSQILVFLGDFQPEANHAEWVHAALNHVEQLRVNPDDEDYRTSALVGLLQALRADPGALTVPPPKTTLRVILWALSAPGNIAEIAFELLCNAPAWFQDAELQIMMQKSSVWQLLGRFASTESAKPWSRAAYFQLGDMLAKRAQWGPIVRDDLAGWVTVFLQERMPYIDFKTGLLRVWLNPGGNEVDQTPEDNPFILIFEALSKAWDDFDITQPRNIYRLAKCTTLAAVGNRYYGVGRGLPIPPDFRVTFSARLRNSIIQITEKARAEINSSQGLELRNEALGRAATILERIATHIPCKDSGVDSTDEELAVIRDQIIASIDALEGRFSEISLVLEVVQ